MQNATSAKCILQVEGILKPYLPPRHLQLQRGNLRFASTFVEVLTASTIGPKDRAGAKRLLAAPFFGTHAARGADFTTASMWLLFPSHQSATINITRHLFLLN